MSHYDEEQELAIIASFKDKDALDRIANATVSNEDPDDGGYHGVLDGIYAGLGKKSKKKVWGVQDLQPGTKSSDFDTGLFYFFIDASFEAVKNKIQALPDLLTTEEVELLRPKIKIEIPTSVSVANLREEGIRGVRVTVPHDCSVDNLPKKIEEISIRYQIQMAPRNKKTKTK